MYSHVDHIVFSREEIAEKTALLGEKISQDYRDKEIILIGILKSALFFMADLMRHISVPLIIDFIEITSYGENGRSAGPVRIIKDLEEDIHDRHVVVVEDMADTGLTLSYVLKHIRSKKPLSLKTCTLINKTDCRLTEIPIDYWGFETTEGKLAGYGSDFNDRFRHYPFICRLKEEDQDGTAMDFIQNTAN